MRNKSVVFNTIVNVVLVICALTMVGVYTVRSRATMPPQIRPATVPNDWLEEMRAGIIVGPDDASLKVVEFLDFQCPACAVWVLRLDSLVSEYPNQVQISVHHLPIESRHPYATGAAVAAECAHEQDMFREFSTHLFKNQILIGVKPWEEFAADVQVPDMGGFRECVSRPVGSFKRIAYGRALANRTGVRATPTVWLNGRIQRPSLRELRLLVENLAEGD